MMTGHKTTGSMGSSKHTITWTHRAGGVSVKDKATLVTRHQVSSVPQLERIHSGDKDLAIALSLACCSLRTPLDRDSPGPAAL